MGYGRGRRNTKRAERGLGGKGEGFYKYGGVSWQHIYRAR